MWMLLTQHNPPQVLLHLLACPQAPSVSHPMLASRAWVNAQLSQPLTRAPSQGVPLVNMVLGRSPMHMKMQPTLPAGPKPQHLDACRSSCGRLHQLSCQHHAIGNTLGCWIGCMSCGIFGKQHLGSRRSPHSLRDLLMPRWNHDSASTRLRNMEWIHRNRNTPQCGQHLRRCLCGSHTQH